MESLMLSRQPGNSTETQVLQVEEPILTSTTNRDVLRSECSSNNVTGPGLKIPSNIGSNSIRDYAAEDRMLMRFNDVNDSELPRLFEVIIRWNPDDRNWIVTVSTSLTTIGTATSNGSMVTERELMELVKKAADNNRNLSSPKTSYPGTKSW